jgi:hypothetical protein
MRRFGGLVSAVGAVAVLAGCAALTDPATNVTSTSATLNAHGQTNGTPAHYYFRYANNESDLGTAAAKRTPRRGPIPPNTPGNGGNVSFAENVSGLSPGRTYFFEVCGGDRQVHRVCGGVQSFFTTPTAAQNSVRGQWKLSPQGLGARGSVDAASDPSGANADGTITWLSEGGDTFAGRVTCLAVSGNTAAVGAVGRLTGQSDLGPQTFLLTVIDDGPVPGFPQYELNTIGQIQSDGSTPPDCSAPPTYNEHQVPLANIVVHPATP